MNILTLIKNSTVKVGIVSLASLGGLSITTSAQAVQIDFSTWQTIGDVATPSVGRVNLSNNGLQNDDFPQPDSNFNYSGNAAVQAAPFPDLQDFIGVAVDALDINGFAFEGSAIKGTVTIPEGSAFRFNWNFRTNETSNRDFSFFKLDNTIITLTNQAVQPSAPFLRETGNRFYELTTPGTYNIVFAVGDVDDYGTTSAVEISNARVEVIPEPLTILGSLTALGLGAGMRRRFGKQKAASAEIDE